MATMVALLATLVPMLLYIDRYPTISPVDEFHHIDYAIRISHGDLLGRGDRFGDEMMREFACRRLDASEITFEVPPCDAPEAELTPEKFPESGYNSAFIHPPTYYMVAAVGGIVGEWFGLSFVSGARAANLLWLVAFIGLVMMAARWLNLSPTVGALAAVVCVVNPGSLHALATVNPDAAGLACGAAALVGYLGWRRSSNLWWLLLVVVPVVVKSTHALASAAALVLVAAECWFARFDDAESQVPTVGRRTALRSLVSRFRPVLVGGIGFFGAAVGVLIVQRVQASGPADVIDQLNRFHVDRFPIGQVLGNVIMVPPLSGYLPRALNTDQIIMAVTLLTLLVMLGMVLGLANRRDPEDQLVRNIGVVALAATVCAGPGLIVLNYGLNAIYVDIPPRYLISLVPLLVLVAAGAFGRVTVTRWALIASSSLMWVTLVHAMWTVSAIGVVH